MFLGLLLFAFIDLLFLLALSNELTIDIAPTVPTGQISYKTLKYGGILKKIPFVLKDRRVPKTAIIVEGETTVTAKNLGRAHETVEKSFLDNIDGKERKFSENQRIHKLQHLPARLSLPTQDALSFKSPPFPMLNLNK